MNGEFEALETELRSRYEELDTERRGVVERLRELESTIGVLRVLLRTLEERKEASRHEAH